MSGPVVLRVTDLVTGEVVRELEGEGGAGLHRVQWDLRGPLEVEDDGDIDPGDPGVYRVTPEAGGMTRSATVRVLEDVWVLDVP